MEIQNEDEINDRTTLNYPEREASCFFYLKRVSFKMYKPTKNYFRKKAIKLCIRGQIVIKSQSLLKY